MNPTRIWDLPTRLFHWALAACVIALVITAKVGGDAMNWHFRLGYAVFALLIFRLLWGFVGGHWSRFASFFPTPGRLSRYLGGRATAADTAGHNPLGALSVLALLTVLSVQVGTGLFTDDEIAFAGPLTSLVSGDTVWTLTSWHKTWGQWLVIGLVVGGIITTIGNITGSSLNPARTFGPYIGDYILGGNSLWHFFPIYIIGPVAGALIAAFLYDYLSAE